MRKSPETGRLASLLAAALLALAAFAPHASAQSPPTPAAPMADELADAALGAGEAPAEAAPAAAPTPLELFFKGGWLMGPIVLMSVIAAAVAVERLFALRRARVTPRALERGLKQLAEVGDFEPRTAYRLCQQYPSALARVVTAMVAQAGRPQDEVATAASEANQREADKLFANVRTLNLTSAVTPLMGLLGTVGGMIVAFYQTQALPAGQNKSDALAEGIYLALVTTFAGLVVAIPAAVLAHYFEGRIQRIARRIEGLVQQLLPRLERFEGGPRIDLAEIDALDQPVQHSPPPAAWPPPGNGAPPGSESTTVVHNSPAGQSGPPNPHDAMARARSAGATS